MIKRKSLQPAAQGLLFTTLLLPSIHSANTAVLREQPPPWASEPVISADIPVIGRGVRLPPKNISPPVAPRIPQQSPLTEVQRLLQAAEANNPRAQYDLALRHLSGQGVSKDVTQSIYWLTRAAHAGEANAQYRLAVMYRKGEAGEIDKAHALHWLKEAAKRNHTDAQYYLGLAYLQGDGMRSNRRQAEYWFDKAAMQGHAHAGSQLAQLRAAPMTAAIVRAPITETAPRVAPIPAPQRAVQPRQVVQAPQAPIAPVPTPAPLPPMAAKRIPSAEIAVLSAVPSTSRQSQTATGMAEQVRQQANGIGQPGNKVNLAGMNPDDILQLAKSKDRYAQFLIGAMYEDGSNGFQQNYREAARWYRRAAKQRYAKAQYNLALLYEDGRGVGQDHRTAKQWYEQAARNGFHKAKNNLGILYVLGKGVRKDRKKAAALFSQAAAEGNADAARNLEKLRR